MKNSTKAGIIICLVIMVAFSLSVVFAGNEKANATKAMNMINVTMNMTNAKTKDYRRDLYLNNVPIKSNPYSNSTSLPISPTV